MQSSQRSGVLRKIAAIEVLAEYGMPLAALASVPDSMEEAVFLTTAEDLIYAVQLPADPDTNPLGLRDPTLLDHPRAFLAGMLAKFEQLHEGDADTSFRCLEVWLGEQGIRCAASINMLRCRVGIPTAWTSPAHAGAPASTHQKLLYCASAMTRMPIQTAQTSGSGLYDAEEISPAALKRLSGLGRRQIDRLVALAEQVLAESGATMLDELVGSCLAKTNLEYQVSLDELKASLVGVGFYPPLAQAIALSWQAAIGSLQTMPIHMRPGLNVTHTMRVIHEHTVSHAPTLFAAEMQRQLAAHRLPENLQTTMGETNDEGLHALFQIQCDQLRQFCEQLLGSSTSNTASTPRQ